MNWISATSPPAPGTTALVYLREPDVIITATYVVQKWMSRGEKVEPSHWQGLPDRPSVEQD